MQITYCDICKEQMRDSEGFSIRIDTRVGHCNKATYLDICDECTEIFIKDIESRKEQMK